MTSMLLLLVCTRFQSLFHSPNRGSFHLSLTVLVHYRSIESIQPWRMVPPYSVKISRVPTYSSLPTNTPFRIRDYYPLWLVFPYYSTNYAQLLVTGLLRVRSPLLTESRLISFPLVTQMFQFSRFASLSYEFRQQYPTSGMGFPIRKSPDQSFLLAPRSLSQVNTSFIAFYCQGIHRVHLIT